MADTSWSLFGVVSSPTMADYVMSLASSVNGRVSFSNIPIPCAQIYTTGGSSSQTPGTSYVKMTQWTADGDERFDNADYANDKITLAQTGLYIVLGSFSFGVGATSGFDASFRVYWNSVAQPQCTAVAADTGGHCVLCGLVDVTTASTDLEVYIKTSVAAKDIDIEEASLIALRVGAT